MSLILDIKYFHLCSSQLERLKHITGNNYNFRCPICGDSEKSKTKARGYVFESDNMLKYKCFNCGPGENGGLISFQNFLKQIDANLYKEYLYESFREKSDLYKGLIPKSEEFDDSLFTQDLPDTFQVTDDKLVSIDNLPEDHPAVQYCNKRKIPRENYYRIYYIDAYKKFCNTYIPNKFKEEFDFPALVFKLLTKDGKLIGFQGRNIGNGKIRYLTCVINTSYGSRRFGEELIDESKPVYIVEGPIDSLFLKNSVAQCGSDLLGADYKHGIYILDCEPRNKQIFKKNESLLAAGKSVCLLPSAFIGMDINDIVLSGCSYPELIELIHSHTYSGLLGQIELKNWKNIS